MNALNVGREGINALISVGSGPQPWARDWMEDERQWAGVGPDFPQLRLNVHVPLIDGAGLLDPAAAEGVVALAVKLLQDPVRRLLIHCDAGAFRSVAIVAAVLAKMTGRPSAWGVAKVDRARFPGATPRTGIGLPDWDRWLHGELEASL